MPNVYDAHTHLYHYTSFEGLRGILESQSLWATHYKSLNDFSEVEHMRAFLERAVYPIVNRIMRERVQRSLKFRLYVERNGGLHACSLKEARKTVSILYGVTFSGREGSKIGAFAEPYVVSFCAHTGHDDYVKTNGLLSMWRAYGNDGGFALVFDTKRLWDWLQPETQNYAYNAFYLGDVIYDDEEEKFGEEFGILTQKIEQFVRDFAEGAGDPGPLFQPFFDAVTRFKHRGFKEEREVRLTAAPVSEALEWAVRGAEGGSLCGKRIKQLMTRDKGTIQARYIVINGAQKPLPVMRIIVGPQLNLADRIAQVRGMSGSRIEVVASETPYLPL